MVPHIQLGTESRCTRTDGRRVGLALLLVLLVGPGLVFAQQREDAVVPHPDSGTQMWQQSAALQLQEAGPQSANYVMRAVNIGPPGVVRGDLSVGDVNGDDIPDVLVAGATQSADTTAQLYLGNGDGTFTEADADLMGVEFAATAMGDLDDDGNMDLVITGGVPDGFGTEPTTTVYYGNGDGTFSDGDTDLMGYTDGSVSIADVDEDGHEDILLTGEDENSETSVRLYLNDGDGSFSEADAGLTDVEAGASSIADVDGDGAPDLLLSGNFATGLYLNNGDGTFTEAGADLIEAQQSATAIADVDDDGHPDLLVAGEHFQSEKVAKLYLGDGEGDFTEADPGFEGVASGILETGDVDGDGHEDVLLAGATLGTDQPDDFVARLYLGDGNGSFEEAGAGLTGVARGGGAIADVDDDGDQDLFLAGVGKLYGWPSTRLYVNRTEQEGSNRSPEFAEIMDVLQEEPLRLAPGLSADLPAEAGDLDGDEVTLSVGQGENISMDDAGNGTGTVTVAPERDQAGETIPVELDAEDPDGAVGTFSADVDVPGLLAAEEAGLSQVGYWSLSAGDVDGDGNLDVLATGEDDNQNETTLYLGTDDGTFVESEADLEGVQFGSSAIGDVNDDGEPDLVVTGVNDDNVPETTVYLNNGDGTFSEAGADLNGVRNGSVSIGDVDADGHPDVLLAGQAGEDFVPSATLYLGEGDGTFTESDADLTAVGDYANERSSTTMADVDGDGNQDLLILGTAGSATATLYLGDGDGDFTEANAGFAGVSNGSASVADVDGDGHRDVLIIGRDAGFSPSTTLYLGDGEGGFTEAGADLPAVENGMATIANVDEDEHPDVLLTGQDEDMVPTTKVYLGEGDGTFEDGEAGLEDMRESRMVVGDMDGDGDLDAVVSGETPFNEDRTRLYDNLAVDDDPVASASASISGSDTTSFGDTGLSISFADGTGSGTVSVSRFDDAPEAPDGIAEENVSNYRVVISSDPDFSVGDSTEVRFDASDFDGVENPDSVVVYSREGVGTGAFDPLPTAYDEGDDELIATVEGFSEFAFASDSDPLPVELAGMEATTGEESVRIEWQTAAEENNAGFAVERRAGSGDESEWTELGFVKSAAEGGTTDRPQAYRFVDEDLPYEADRLAYRLRQVDADGTTETFAPVEVERGVQTLQLEKVVPTPASGQATVRLAVPEKQEVRVAVYDLLGRSVRTVAEGPMEGREEVTVDLGGLSSGTYFVRLTAEGEVQTRRLVVVQ